jgi:hypothetical protein
MAKGPASLPGTERLYRLLGPELWLPESMEILPTAFLDEGKGYARLSLYIANRCSPRQVLEIFARFKGIQARYPGADAERLWHEGFGVGFITVDHLAALGLEFEKNRYGRIEMKANGHVNILDGQSRAADLALVALALSYEEIFSGAPDHR